jgi:hypothetical protein
MLKNRSVSLLILILSAGIVLSLLWNNSITMKTVEAQQNDKSKWEYCRVSKISNGADSSGKNLGSAYIEFFTYPAIRKETITVESFNSRDVAEDALSQAFFKLGEARWEMTQIESTSNSLYYHFKRLKL